MNEALDQLAQAMLRILLLGGSAFIMAMILTPVYTYFAYRYKFWKKQKTVTLDGKVLEVISKLHARKIARRIPTMAGLVFVIAIAVTTLIFNFSRPQTWLPLAALIAGAVIGLIDDILNLRSNGGVAGLRAPVKFTMVTIVGLLLGWFFWQKLGFTTVHIPFIGPWDLGVWIVPVFALANAGVDVRGGLLAEAFGSPVTWGVIAGLVLGKLLGIGLTTLVAIRLGLGRLPEGVGVGSVFGGAALSGIGFTVSLLIIGLAFGTTSDLGRQATVGVLVSMMLATLLGRLIFKVAARRWGEETADLPMLLEPPVDPEVDHIRGPEDAQLTLVEYVDFECAYCAHATGSWEDLRAHFGDDLRYVVRQLPHHPHGPIAARASEAASNQGMFWPWLDFVFTRQHALEREDLIGYAVELGLDVDRFIADLDSPAVIERVERDLASAVASGAHATPTFFVEGRRLRGSYDARTVTAALEASRRGTRTQEVPS